MAGITYGVVYGFFDGLTTIPLPLSASTLLILTAAFLISHWFTWQNLLMISDFRCFFTPWPLRNRGCSSSNRAGLNGRDGGSGDIFGPVGLALFFFCPQKDLNRSAERLMRFAVIG